MDWKKDKFIAGNLTVQLSLYRNSASLFTLNMRILLMFDFHQQYSTEIHYPLPTVAKHI